MFMIYFDSYKIISKVCGMKFILLTISKMWQTKLFNAMYIWHILSSKTKCCQTVIVFVLVILSLLSISYKPDFEDANKNGKETRERYSFLYYSINIIIVGNLNCVRFIFVVTHINLEYTLICAWYVIWYTFEIYTRYQT